MQQVELDGAGPHMMSRNAGVRGNVAGALSKMADYPRRTMAGGAAGLGAMGAYGSARRRGSQNYPMY